MDLRTIASEPVIRLTIFLGVLATVAIWETAAPRRARMFSRGLRWPNNLGIVILDTLCVRLLFPVAAVGVAARAQAIGWGLMGATAAPAWVAIPTCVVALDLVLYAQHVVFHRAPILWRLHRMHHADPDFDVTTALRFHPFEIILSMLIKFTAIVALGAPPAAVLVFEILLNAMAMFNHANAGLPAAIEQNLRRLIVTPDMHRVHHSIAEVEMNSNFGFNLALWDRLFGTYRAQPAAGHDGMTIGLSRFRSARDLALDRMLVQPFARDE